MCYLRRSGFGANSASPGRQGLKVLSSSDTRGQGRGQRKGPIEAGQLVPSPQRKTLLRWDPLGISRLGNYTIMADCGNRRLGASAHFDAIA